MYNIVEVSINLNNFKQQIEDNLPLPYFYFYIINPLLILVQGPKINENENEIYENKEIISFFSR